MKVVGIIFFSVAGLLWPTTEGRECYNCANCEGELGILLDCSSFSNSSSCYLSKTISTGEISKACGATNLDLLGLSVGCATQDDVVVCRCIEDRCNVDGLLTPTTSDTTISPTTTTSVAASASAITTVQATQSSSSWQCYTCSNCGSSVGTLVECSTYSASRSCLLVKELSGEVTRTCGLEVFDNFGLADRCGTTAGITICKCSENACNKYPEFLTGVPSSEATRPAPTAGTTSPTISHSGFYCHVCQDCGDSVGQLAACPTSMSCALVIENGRHSRFCGTAAVDIQIHEQSGCRISGDLEICKCSVSECNTYFTKTGITANENFLPQQTFLQLSMGVLPVLLI